MRAIAPDRKGNPRIFIFLVLPTRLTRRLPAAVFDGVSHPSVVAQTNPEGALYGLSFPVRRVVVSFAQRFLFRVAHQPTSALRSSIPSALQQPGRGYS